jgi:hypothetical protein
MSLYRLFQSDGNQTTAALEIMKKGITALLGLYPESLIERNKKGNHIGQALMK